MYIDTFLFHLHGRSLPCNMGYNATYTYMYTVHNNYYTWYMYLFRTGLPASVSCLILLCLERQLSYILWEIQVCVLIDTTWMPSLWPLPSHLWPSGYIASVTQFPDHFREEIYWLSESGQLLGVLPSVGQGPHGFFSATLSPKSSSSLHKTSVEATSKDGAAGYDDDNDDDSAGLYVYFNDGMGGIVCLRPTVWLFEIGTNLIYTL